MLRRAEVIAAIAGPDGSGKSSLVNAAGREARRLVLTGVVGSLGDNSSIGYGESKLEPLFPDVTRRIRQVYDLGKHQGNRPVLFAAMVLHSMFTGRVVEPKMQRAGVKLIIRDREPILDPLVLFHTYTGTDISPTALSLAVRVASNPSRTDLLFLLTIDSETALRRSKSSTSPDFHESLECMEAAQVAYKNFLLTRAMKRQVSEIVFIDTGTNNLVMCTGVIMQSLLAKLGY